MSKQNGYYKAYTGKRRGARVMILGGLGLCLAVLFTALAVRWVRDGGLDRAGPEETAHPLPTLLAAVPTPDAPDSEKPPAETEQPLPEPPEVKVKGLYVTGWSAGIPERMSHYINLCDKTELNALVIDVKDDRGQITFISGAEGPGVEALSRASVNIIPNIEETVSLLKSHGIYTIARIVCFKDPVWSAANSSLAIHNKAGKVWKDNNGNAWLNPYNPSAWDYIVTVSKEAARVGFDEVQLDYVRFPTDGKISEIDYGSSILTQAGQSKAETIQAFLSFVRNALAEDNIKLSADVFGIILTYKGDIEGIGQDLELIAQSVDYICPMIYPSHYANEKQNGTGQEINKVLFEAPDTQPYEVIYNSLQLIQKRLLEKDSLQSGPIQEGIRPYLQDFTASYLGKGYYQEYTAAQVSEQIQAVYDAGFEEWILWNASGVYSEEAFS